MKENGAQSGDFCFSKGALKEGALAGASARLTKNTDLASSFFDSGDSVVVTCTPTAKWIVYILSTP